MISDHLWGTVAYMFVLVALISGEHAHFQISSRDQHNVNLKSTVKSFLCAGVKGLFEVACVHIRSN